MAKTVTINLDDEVSAAFERLRGHLEGRIRGARLDNSSVLRAALFMALDTVNEVEEGLTTEGEGQC